MHFINNIDLIRILITEQLAVTMSARRQSQHDNLSFSGFDEGASFSNVRLTSQRVTARKEVSPLRPSKVVNPSSRERQNIAPNLAVSPIVRVKEANTVQFLEGEVKRLEQVIFYVGTSNDKLIIQCDEQQKEIAYLKISGQREKEQSQVQKRKLKELLNDKMSECDSISGNARRQKEILERQNERIKAQLKTTIERKNDDIFAVKKEKELQCQRLSKQHEAVVQQLKVNCKKQIQDYEIRITRFEEEISTWKEKFNSLKSEYEAFQESVNDQRLKMAEQSQEVVSDLKQRYHRNKMLMLETSKQEVESMEEASLIQKEAYQMEIKTLNNQINLLEFENKQLAEQSTLTTGIFQDNIKQYETAVETLKFKLSKIHRTKNQEIQILKIKAGALHCQNLKAVEDTYAPKVLFLSEKIKAFEEEIDKLHDVLSKQLEKNSSLIRDMRIKEARHHEELIKVRMMHENAQEEMRQRFATEQNLNMQQSAQLIKTFEMKANSANFYEEELRKLRKQLDDQSSQGEEKQAAFEEEKRIWQSERELLLANIESINQNSEKTVRELKGIIDDKSHQIDHLSKEILKSIRESPLPDYSKYIEQIQSLKKQLLQKQEGIKLWKEKFERAEKKCRENMAEFEKINLENDVIINEAKAQWEALAQHRIDSLEQFHKKKLQYVQTQRDQCKQLNVQLQNKITQLMLSYKQLENGLTQMMVSVQRRSELQQKLILLGTDGSLVSAKQQLFEY